MTETILSAEINRILYYLTNKPYSPTVERLLLSWLQSNEKSNGNTSKLLAKFLPIALMGGRSRDL